MAILSLPETSGIQYGERLDAKPSLDAYHSRILGEAILSERRPTPVLRFAVIPFQTLDERAAAGELRTIWRRCHEHLHRAAAEWARRGGDPSTLGARINALRHERGSFWAHVAAREAIDSEYLFIGALRYERTLVGEERTTPEAIVFIEELDRQLERLEIAYPPTPLSVLDHARAVRVARDALIHAHLCIPVRWAKRVLRFARVPFDDLVQAGNEGLIQAAEAYDWRHGAPFAAYLYPWVKSKVSRVERHGDAVLLPLALHAARGRVRKALEAAEGLVGARGDVASAVGLRPDALEAIEASTHHVSIDEDATVRTIADGAPRPAELAERRERTVLLGAALGRCGPQEAEVLRRHYGINCAAMTMRELARAMQLSTQRLYQLKAAGLRQLQTSDTRSLLADYAA